MYVYIYIYIYIYIRMYMPISADSPRARACENRASNQQANTHRPPIAIAKQSSHQPANTQLRSATASFRHQPEPISHRSPASHMKPPGRQLGPTAHQSQQASGAANRSNSPMPPAAGLRSVDEGIRPPVSGRQPPLRPPVLTSSLQDPRNLDLSYPISRKERCTSVAYRAPRGTLMVF